MSELTLDTAIKHCLDVAEQNETQAEKWYKEGGAEWGKTINCRECAADHRQLAEWLRELREAKRLLKDFVSEYDGCKTFPNRDEVLKLIGEDENET